MRRTRHAIIAKALSIVWPGDRDARWCGVKVGSGFCILTRHFGTEPVLIEVGDNVTISGGVSLITHDGASWPIRDENGRRNIDRRIRIGGNVFVGAASALLSGVSLGYKVLLGAGSVVTKYVPNDTVVVGNPAKGNCSYSEYRTRILKVQKSEKGLKKISMFEMHVMNALTPGFRPVL